jgi:hypothetical protein
MEHKRRLGADSVQRTVGSAPEADSSIAPGARHSRGKSNVSSGGKTLKFELLDSRKLISADRLRMLQHVI